MINQPMPFTSQHFFTITVFLFFANVGIIKVSNRFEDFPMFTELTALLISQALNRTPFIEAEITPVATINRVCYPNSCSSSWVPHDTDNAHIGNEPQVFNIPAGDRR
jgi:hypothetical protein